VTAALEKKRLIEQHLSLVQAIARKLKKTISASIDFEDLVGYGSKGLVEAAERFDPSHGVAFTTFAYYRVRGAMFDGLRTMGWYSRADYARYRAEERANELMQSHADQDGATRATMARETVEGADAGGTTAAGSPSGAAGTLASVAEMLSGIATVHITSLEAAAGLADESLPAADAQLDLGRLGARVRDAIKRLPERERQLMELYYFAGKNLEEAGSVMGLSKSWACRLHARAINLLRDALADAID
jgi:RNA polymerase sigma factor for flagellar operon FliA